MIIPQYYSDLFLAQALTRNDIKINTICLQREVVTLLRVGRNDCYHDRSKMDVEDQQISKTSETGITPAIALNTYNIQTFLIIMLELFLLLVAEIFFFMNFQSREEPIKRIWVEHIS